MGIAAIDHWVLVVKDLEETFAFYRKIGLDAGWQERPGGRGKRPIIRISETQKVNLYVVDRYTTESPTHAPNYATGGADFCLRWEGTVQEAHDFLQQAPRRRNLRSRGPHRLPGRRHQPVLPRPRRQPD